MHIVLLGTGGAGGWPNPWCSCASCASMRTRGEIRGEAAALVDDVLLLDCGPETGRAAERCGHPLTGVRTVLLTHAHPDHAAAPPWMWRRWAGREEPVRVVGPPAALAVAGAELQPGDPVTLDAVDPWDERDVDGYPDGGYRVQAVPAAHGGPEIGPAVLWDVTGASGARLLYATDTAPLPEATLDRLVGRRFDLLLLECAFGDTPIPGQDHHGLETWPRTVAALRERGVVDEDTALVATHLTHGNPPPPELADRFAAFGATAPPDGTTLRVRSASHG